jgi:hypothetical protein
MSYEWVVIDHRQWNDEWQQSGVPIGHFIATREYVEQLNIPTYIEIYTMFC